MWEWKVDCITKFYTAKFKQSTSALRTPAITDIRYYGHPLLRTPAITLDADYYGHLLLRQKPAITGIRYKDIHYYAGRPLLRTHAIIYLDVNFCKDHRNKIEVSDPFAVEDLISSKLNNKRKLARLIFPIFRKARPSFFKVLQRMTKVFNVTSLKYGKYDITNEKINNNKRLIDRAR